MIMVRIFLVAVVAVILAAAITVPFAASAQSVSLTAEQRLQKAFDKRAELESQIREIEQEEEARKQEKAKIIPLVSREDRIASVRERIDKLDRTIEKLKDEAAREARGETVAKPASSSMRGKTAASEQKTAKPKELSLVDRQMVGWTWTAVRWAHPSARPDLP